ncbi:MAG TPA: amidohydrolase family protein [Candidatus Brocadiia bacterium]|nr:amidohydrolase family protein [Candidatus Brocadiia bacterium]
MEKKLIDIHVHTCPRPTTTRPNGQTYATPEQLIERYDAIGVAMAVILPQANPECAHRRLSDDECLAICNEYPCRFIPFCNVDPRYLTNSPEADFSPLLNYYKERGCKGVGECAANLPFDDPLVLNLFKHCEACGMPLTFHVATQRGGMYGLIDELGLPRLERALAMFPGLIFLGHSQAFWSEISGDVTAQNRGGYPKGPIATGGRVVELMRRYPNLHGDLSAGSGHNAVSRDPEFGCRFMNEFQDRLYFGTDICAPDTPTPLVGFLKEMLDSGGISREVYERIGWRNAEILLGLDPQD